MSHSPRFCSLTPSFSRLNFAYLALILAALLLSASIQAQVTYTGTAATQNFGSQAVGSTSSVQTLTFSVAAGTTLGSIGVLTQGAPNLDFTDAGGDSCTAQTYASATTCTVNVAFKPGHPGLRMGAVVFFTGAANTGTSQGQVLIYGVGTGPQVTFASTTSGVYLPSATSILGSGISTPWGLTVDGAGNVFVSSADIGAGNLLKVYEIEAAGGYTTVNTLGVEVYQPGSIAVDGAGHIYIADPDDDVIVEAQGPSYYTVNRIGSGFNGALGVAIDGSGNIFVADSGNNAVKEILAAGGYTTINTLGGGFKYPSDVAVDRNGNVFVSDSENHAVKEIPAGCIAGTNDATCVLTLYNVGTGTDTLALDASGNIFITVNGSVDEILAAGGYTKVNTIGSGFIGPRGIALDAAGDVFVGDFSAGSVTKLDYADPPTLTFAGTTVGVESIDSPQKVRVANDGNGVFVFSALSYPADFSEASGDPNACKRTTGLDAGQACELPIEFDPGTAGTLSETVTLTDDALNVIGAQQSITVSGTGGQAVAGATHFSVTATSPGTVYTRTPFSITVTALDSSNHSPIAYNGTVSFTSSDPGFVNPGSLTLSSGTGQAMVTFQTFGTQTITATDATTSTLQGLGSFSVAPEPILPTSGTPSSVNFGSQPVGTASTARTLNFAIPAGTSVGSIGVLTQGASNLDFNEASGGTCAAQAYATATTCTVNVTFTPSHPGVRTGAVVFYSETGGTGISLGQLLLYGTGTGPQVTFANTTTGVYLPSAVSPLGNQSESYYWGVAVDGSGNLFVTSYFGSGLYEIVAAGGYTTVKLVGAYPSARSVVVDGAGNIFLLSLIDSRSGAVYEILAAGGYSTFNTIVAHDIDYPTGIAIDVKGNLFIADNGIASIKEVVADGGYNTIKTLGGGLFEPFDVAVDASGNVFVDVFGLGEVVKEIPASCIAGANDASCVLTLGGDFTEPFGIAVDGIGNIIVADSGHNAVKEILAAGGYTTVNTLISGLNGGPSSVAVDGSGNVYFTDSGTLTTFLAEKLDYADPPTLDFEGTTLGVESSDSPQKLTVFNDGNSDLTFPVPSDGDNPTMPSGFTLDASTTCPQLNSSSSAGTLAAGASCNYAVDFTPAEVGSTSGSMLLTDDSLNASPAVTQSITLVGATVGPHLVFTTPPPANLTAGLSPGSVQVSVETPNNTVVTTSIATVTLVVTGPNSYSQTYTATASSGVAAFSSLAALNIAGSYTYTATDTPDGFTEAIATESVVEPHLVFTTPPPNALKAGKAPGSVVVSVEAAGGSVITSSSATITLTVTGPSSYSQTYTATAASGVASFSSLATLNVAGSYTYTATDTADGFTQAVATETVNPAPPFGGITQAVDSVTLSTTVGQADSLLVSGWVADIQDGAPLSNVTVLIDGTSVGTPTLGIANSEVAKTYGTQFLNSGFRMLYAATSLSLGSHNVTVIAIDSGGRTTTFGPSTFTVAAAAGAGSLIGVLGPAEDSVTFSTTVGQSDSVNINGWVFEPGASVPLSNVTVYIDGGSVGAPTLGVARPGVAAQYSSSYLDSGYQLLYPATSLSLGAHNVTVIAVDSGGHSTTFGPVAFTVATAAGPGSPFGVLNPAVDSVTSSTSVSPSDSVNISGWVFDPGNGVEMSSVTVYIDGTSLGAPTLGFARPGVAQIYGSSYRNSGFQMLYPASSLSGGAHVVTVIAIDSGGRSTTLGPVQFTVQ